MTLHSALSIQYPSHDSLTGLSPVAVWVISAWTLLRCLGGHLVFFPSQLLKYKHPSCLDLPNEHLVFQSSLPAGTGILYFFLSWGGRQGCSALCRPTHSEACKHTCCCSPRAFSVSRGTRWDSPAGPHTRTRMYTHSCDFWIHAHSEIVHAHTTLSFSHLASCLVWMQCNGILQDYCDPLRCCGSEAWCVSRRPFGPSGLQGAASGTVSCTELSQGSNRPSVNLTKEQQK